MNLQEIRNFLKKIFSKPLEGGKKRHIVFWYDDNEDFIEDIDTLDLSGVKLLRLTPNNAFRMKYYIEKEDLESNILIYSNMSKPRPEEDYLLDIFCYSEEFSTDRATVIMREFGISDLSLKEDFKKYNIFFKNKERIANFKALNIKDYTKEKIKLGVLSVLTKVKIIDIEEIIKVLIKEYLDGGKKLYTDIKKFGSEEDLWNIIDSYYGYNFDEYSLEKFMATLLISNLNENINFELQPSYKRFISNKTANCIVFINHFMNDERDNIYYDKMQEFIAEKLNIEETLEKQDTSKFINCNTFEDVDKIIIKRISNLLENNVEEYQKYLSIIAERRTKHFYKKYHNIYKVLSWTINLLNKKKELSSTIKEENSYKITKTYVKEYSYIDKAYRKFYYYFDNCLEKDNFKSLRDKVENIYNNWYLQELSLKWYESLKEQQGWRIDGLKQQDRFYKDFIRDKYKERVYVIISDGLRYESGEELSTLLTNERKGKVELDYMQGVIPSYTKLGMASLLPHKNLEINNKYDVIIDGLNSSSTENRNNILQREVPKSIAITYDKLIDMGNNDIRKVFGGLDLVYIYHNTIDARGDHGSTEREIFDATEIAFKEILALVNKLVNRVSATRIIITADHGYLYKRDSIQEYDKICGVKLDDDEDGRRFILTSNSKEIEGTISFNMDYLLCNNDKNVITPRGNSRFKVQGAGANYVHGGAMLQEVIIPVITFKNDRSTSSVNDIRKVNISLSSVTRKLTNIITYLDFFQSEKIQDKVIVKKIKCYFEDEDGNRISNEELIIGDSNSDNPVERTYRKEFVLKSMQYDKNKQYFLVIKDIEDVNSIGERIAFTIDIAIVDDFEF